MPNLSQKNNSSVSFKVINDQIYEIENLDLTEMHFLSGIYNLSKLKGYTWISNEKFAEGLKISVSTLKRIIDKFIKMGFIEVSQKGWHRQMKCTQFLMNLIQKPKIIELSSCENKKAQNDISVAQNDNHFDQTQVQNELHKAKEDLFHKSKAKGASIRIDDIPQKIDPPIAISPHPSNDSLAKTHEAIENHKLPFKEHVVKRWLNAHGDHKTYSTIEMMLERATTSPIANMEAWMENALKKNLYVEYENRKAFKNVKSKAVPGHPIHSMYIYKDCVTTGKGWDVSLNIPHKQFMLVMDQTLSKIREGRM